MQPGTVLPLEDRAFPAYGLDRVEGAVPDGHAGQGEGAHQVAFHGNKEIPPDDHGNEQGNDSGHGNHFPVALVDKKPELLAQVNRDLGSPPAVAEKMKPP